MALAEEPTTAPRFVSVPSSSTCITCHVLYALQLWHSGQVLRALALRH